jgi:hypothetical protein
MDASPIKRRLMNQQNASSGDDRADKLGGFADGEIPNQSVVIRGKDLTSLVMPDENFGPLQMILA